MYRDKGAEPILRPLRESDLDAAEGLFRRAFATEFGLATTTLFRPGARLVSQRFRMQPDGGFALDAGGELVGFALINRWGNFGLLGPVCVDPSWWNRGLARRLIKAVVERLDHWGCTASGLFTNPSSPRHFRLYESFGYAPGPVTVIVERQVKARDTSDLAVAGVTPAFLEAAGRLTGNALPGLNLNGELDRLATAAGDVLARWSGNELTWFAVVHRGVPSEAEGDEVYVKFAQIAGEAETVDARLDDMLASLETYAGEHGATRITVGISVARERLYRRLLSAGYQGRFHGVHMVRGSWPDHKATILEDWR
ncbi:GNAT family N-acetyltransferase [Mesorhizobium sp. DCY119]|uniref:GNAT family N-acetyltransferase n=1 Tax=Mesorhizobium sp. DCY119 TaxID=2108445 RepID=UPI001403F45D|nr:GNAT family N-acetyltransferase [Mesorhizobium sp. DCY119]